MRSGLAGTQTPSRAVTKTIWQLQIQALLRNLTENQSFAILSLVPIRLGGRPGNFPSQLKTHVII
jgi:hypothetical protein